MVVVFIAKPETDNETRTIIYINYPLCSSDLFPEGRSCAGKAITACHP